MARPKGGKNRKWTNEERLKYVLMCEEENIPVCTLAREEGIPRGTLQQWVNRYRKGGEEALNPEKMHPGNHFSALHSSKSLSEKERLILLVEKLQIENERLKKGYTVKGVGADKEFVTTKDLNSKQ
ncbi:MAG: helix-turn-helix domain-containing protein [Clostridia bacterium]|jgi:transposase-like protein|nr:helix-turn-helix domain-containing protein [Clostridia bacterium]